MTSSTILLIIGAAFATLIVILSRAKAEAGTQSRVPGMLVLVVLSVLMLARAFLPHPSCITAAYARLGLAAR